VAGTSVVFRESHSHVGGNARVVLGRIGWAIEGVDEPLRDQGGDHLQEARAWKRAGNTAGGLLLDTQVAFERQAQPGGTRILSRDCSDDSNSPPPRLVYAPPLRWTPSLAGVSELAVDGKATHESWGGRHP
jgi:hypothetical protein